MAVLAVDYLGFGKSEASLPSEAQAYKDALAALDCLPVTGLITHRFDSVKKVATNGSPLLVVHGEIDRLIKPELGRRLLDAALGPKAFVPVQGGSHHNTNAVGQPLYREALAQLFELR